MVIAWCWANGLIELGREMPRDAIEVARGGGANLLRAITATANFRLDQTYWVPGISAASTPQTVLAGLEEYVAWLTTLELGIQVNYPIASLGVLHGFGHGEKCAEVHDALRRHFRLTQAEAELACGLMRNRAPADARAVLGIAEDAMQDRMAALFTKTGSGHHADLLQRLYSVLA